MKILKKIKLKYNKSCGIKRTLLFNLYAGIIFGAFVVVSLVFKTSMHYLDINFYHFSVVEIIFIGLFAGYLTALLSLNTFVKGSQKEEEDIRD
jgi:hypothetical protein